VFHSLRRAQALRTELLVFQYASLCASGTKRYQVFSLAIEPYDDHCLLVTTAREIWNSMHRMSILAPLCWLSYAVRQTVLNTRMKAALGASRVHIMQQQCLMTLVLADQVCIGSAIGCH
jgi:hypothetical protein